MTENNSLEKSSEERTKITKENEKISSLEPLPDGIHRNKRYNKNIVKIALLVILLSGVIGGGIAIYYYSHLNSNQAIAEKIWNEHAAEYFMSDYDYQAEVQWDQVHMFLDADGFSDLSNQSKMQFLQRLEQKCSSVKDFQLDYELYAKDTQYWCEGDMLCMDTGKKIDVVEEKCNKVCGLMKKKEIRNAKKNLDQLTKEEFKKFESKITQSYINMVKSKKIICQTTDNEKGTYLGMESMEFKNWAVIEEMGRQLEEFGAKEDLSGYISYAKEVQELEKLAEYDAVTQYINSYSFSSLLDEISNVSRTERSLRMINNSLSSYNYSDIMHTSNPYCRQLYDCLMNYAGGIVHLYNGIWSGEGSSVAQQGAEELAGAKEKLNNIIESTEEGQRKLVQAVEQLPAI
ncbi:MAG: hypothetical protein HFI75_01260 [Lachnospiraceae bacterium]|nr:hypothetical protein [Lachnospiraceae bacterium]